MSRLQAGIAITACVGGLVGFRPQTQPLPQCGGLSVADIEDAWNWRTRGVPGPYELLAPTDGVVTVRLVVGLIYTPFVRLAMWFERTDVDGAVSSIAKPPASVCDEQVLVAFKSATCADCSGRPYKGGPPEVFVSPRGPLPRFGSLRPDALQRAIWISRGGSALSAFEEPERAAEISVVAAIQQSWLGPGVVVTLHEGRIDTGELGFLRWALVPVDRPAGWR